MARAKSKSSRYHVPNLDKALLLVELLGRHPRGLTKTEIVEKLKLSNNIVYRIASTLVDSGYLLRDEVSKRFSLTSKLLDIGCMAVDEYSIANLAWSVLQDLRDATGESVFLGVRLDTECVIIEQLPGLHHIRFVVDVGVRSELHAGAPGKCFVAYLDENDRRKLIAQMKFPRYTERTITTRDAFDVELESIRRCGYAVDRAEVMDGIHCVAGPIYNRRGEVVASMWVTAPAERLPPSNFETMGRTVKAHCAVLSRKLGYTVAGMRQEVV